jgi:hypothetical protein
MDLNIKIITWVKFNEWVFVFDWEVDVIFDIFWDFFIEFIISHVIDVKFYLIVYFFFFKT